MSDTAKVEGHAHLVRDLKSQAIINTDSDAYARYMARKAKTAKKDDEIRDVIRDVNELKNEITDIEDDPQGDFPQDVIDEKIQDVAALMFTSATHSNISVAYDDNTGRLALTGIALTQEQVQDFIAPLFAHAYHTNVTSTYDDTNNRVILESSGGGGSGTGGSLTNSWFLGA